MNSRTKSERSAELGTHGEKSAHYTIHWWSRPLPVRL